MLPVREAIAESASLLARAGVASPRVDAELLAAHVLGVPRGRLALAPPLDDETAAHLRELVQARAQRRPLQHLVGTAPFRRLELAVGPGVFVPRPETELLVTWGLTRLAGHERPVVVDLCSGTGAIALALAGEYPPATVYAVESSPAALDWLARNAEGTGVTVVAGDATDPGTLADLDGRVDLVLSNPPYVPEGTPVEPEVADHDPHAAVFAGADGLDVIRPLVRRVAALLRPGGWVGIEHDDTQGTRVPALLRGAGAFTAVSDHRDWSDRPRFAVARRLAD